MCRSWRKRHPSLVEVSMNSLECLSGFLTLPPHSLGWLTSFCQAFIGQTTYHRSFIKGYSEMAEPLLSMLRSKEFQWGPSERQSFQDLKLALTTPPVLTIPTITELFILDTDASGFTVAAEPGPRWSGKGNWLWQLHSLERTEEELHNAPRAFGCGFFTR